MHDRLADREMRDPGRHLGDDHRLQRLGLLSVLVVLPAGEDVALRLGRQHLAGAQAAVLAQPPLVAAQLLLHPLGRAVEGGIGLAGPGLGLNGEAGGKMHRSIGD